MRGPYTTRSSRGESRLVSALANRNLWILFGCQLASVASSMTMVTIAGVVGTGLASSPALATLPISLMIVGTALATIPAAMLMKAIGRRLGFFLAALVGAAGMLAAGAALVQSSFALLCAGLMLLGVNLAFTQQYRFAAAESVAASRVGRAIALVLLGSIGGAYLGPEIVRATRHIDAAAPYAGTMYALAALLVIAALALLGLRNEPVTDERHGEDPARPLARVVLQPLYLVALGGGVVAYGVMTFIMTATPVSMHVIDGYDMEQTADIVRAHVIAMYAPSLVSGLLIERLGVRRMMALGALAMLITVVVGLQGHAILHYWLALVALGVGWNFLYIGATTLLTRTYRSAERFRAQAINDFGVFATSATGSLLAGTVIHLLGWFNLMLIVIAPLVLMLAALYGVRGRDARPLAAREARRRN